MQHLLLCFVTTSGNVAINHEAEVCVHLLAAAQLTAAGPDYTIDQCRLATLPIQDQEQQSKPLQPVFKREPGTDGKVVGTVEISLVPSTRTRYLTLNAPEVLHMLGVLPDHPKSLTAL